MRLATSASLGLPARRSIISAPCRNRRRRAARSVFVSSMEGRSSDEFIVPFNLLLRVDKHLLFAYGRQVDARLGCAICIAK